MRSAAPPRQAPGRCTRCRLRMPTLSHHCKDLARPKPHPPRFFFFAPGKDKMCRNRDRVKTHSLPDVGMGRPLPFLLPGSHNPRGYHAGTYRDSASHDREPTRLQALGPAEIGRHRLSLMEVGGQRSPGASSTALPGFFSLCCSAMGRCFCIDLLGCSIGVPPDPRSVQQGQALPTASPRSLPTGCCAISQHELHRRSCSSLKHWMSRCRPKPCGCLPHQGVASERSRPLALSHSRSFRPCLTLMDSKAHPRMTSPRAPCFPSLRSHAPHRTQPCMAYDFLSITTTQRPHSPVRSRTTFRHVVIQGPCGCAPPPSQPPALEQNRSAPLHVAGKESPAADPLDLATGDSPTFPKNLFVQLGQPHGARTGTPRASV